jgi:hypothetical protein
VSDALPDATQIALPRPLAWLCAIAVVGTGGYGTAFWASRDSGPPGSAFAPAAQVIRDGFEVGDLIILTPFYATRAREHLGDLHPVAPRDPLAEDLEAHRRFWVFGLFSRGVGLRPTFQAAGHRLVKSSEPVPGITVDLYEVGAWQEVTYDFTRNLKTARVFHEYPDGRKEACDKWSETNKQGGAYGRWTCPHDGDWFFVAPQWHRMGDHLRLCLWAHPPNQGRLLVVYPEVPLTGVIHGHAGHTLNGSLHARERIDLDVHVGEAAHQRFVFGLHETWRPYSLRTSTTGTATVTFGVSTPDAGANHFCFAADVRSP